MGKYDISDYQWEQISEEIPPKTSGCGRAGRGELINAIVWVARTGAPWRELPNEYGPWHTTTSGSGRKMEQSRVYSIK